MSDHEKDERIRQLEAELAELRGQQQSAAPAGDAAATANDEPRGQITKLRTPGANRPKMVLVGIALVLLTLGFFLGIFVTLSKGFDSLAHKAAKTFSQDLDDDAPPPARPAPEAPVPRQDPPAEETAPGL